MPMHRLIEELKRFAKIGYGMLYWCLSQECTSNRVAYLYTQLQNILDRQAVSVSAYKSTLPLKCTQLRVSRV